MIKNNYDEEQYALDEEDFSKNDIIGDQFTDYEILNVISSNTEKFIAKVTSKKNSKIYLMKKLNYNPEKEQMEEEFKKFKNLNHKNIIKYYKWFQYNGSTYIIEEYIDNGTLKDFEEIYKTFNKIIDINLMWSFLYQCISGLKYLHDNDIIHNNISSDNILITNNKVIKLNSIKFSFMLSGLLCNKPRDICDLGIMFKKILGSNENFYPKEMVNLINSMEEYDQNKTIETYFNQISEQYIINTAKVSSIISIFRCLNCFDKFVYSLSQNETIFTESKTPLSFYFLKCLDKFINTKDPNGIILLSYNIKKLLKTKNDDEEINPNIFLEFLMERFNKETNINLNNVPFGMQKIIYNNEKELALQEFQKYFSFNFNSIISLNFSTFLKTKRICNECNNSYYFFNIFPFIEFDLDMILLESKDKNNINNINIECLEDWFLLQKLHKKIISKEYNTFCENCGANTEQREFKQFYSLPKYFIISLNRGRNYSNKFKFKLSVKLNLENKIEMEKSYNKYNLEGIVKRFFDKKNGEYFSSIYRDRKNNTWKKYNGKNEKNVSNILDPLVDDDGLIVMLFYSAVD